MSKIIDYLKDKRLLILGFGREGQSTFSYLRRYLPDKPLTIADRKPVFVEDEKVTLLCGEDYPLDYAAYDVVLKSPGIAFLDDVSYPETTEITCQTDLFLRFCAPTVVGITGSKGKTTTSTLIYEMLKAAGKRVCLIGNIGVPVWEKADEGEDLIAVMEMSSHQLEFTKASPHVAVFVNLYEEHLDHYKTGFSGYADAKCNIARFQTEKDFFIYDPDQDVQAVIDWQRVIHGTPLPVPHTKTPADAFVNRLWNSTKHLKGEHNRQDIAYAVAAVRCFGVEEAAIENAVKGFAGIEHRMEYVGEFQGIAFYNDSIATIPMAVEGAVNALGNVDTLLFGGLDRGIDYTDFLRFLAASGIRNLIGLPETGHTLLDSLGSCGKTLYKARDMEDAVREAYRVTGKGKSCLFSPAAASYNVYRNFEEKGKDFKQKVRQLTK